MIVKEIEKMESRGLSHYEINVITSALLRGSASPRSIARVIAREVFKDFCDTHFLPDRRYKNTLPKKVSDRPPMPQEKEALFTGML